MITTNNLDLYVAISDKVENGDMDRQLHDLRKLIDARLMVIGANKKVEDFAVGDRVRLNDRCGTSYLRGETASVVGKRRTKIVLNLDNPKGRFVRKTSAGEILSAEVIVPIEIVDKI